MKDLEKRRQAARLEETRAQRALLAYRCEANAVKDELNMFLSSNRQSDQMNSKVKERINELVGKTKKKKKNTGRNISYGDSGHKRPTSAGSMRSVAST